MGAPVDFIGLIKGSMLREGEYSAQIVANLSKAKNRFPLCSMTFNLRAGGCFFRRLPNDRIAAYQRERRIPSPNRHRKIKC